MVDEYLIHDEDDDSLIVFETQDALQTRADQILTRIKDHPTVQVEPASFDWLEGNSHAIFRWVEDFVTIEMLTALTADLTLYTEANMMLGARSLDASRPDPHGQLYPYHMAANGGKIMEA
eukprot:813335-Prymnesium_polylepis.1